MLSELVARRILEFTGRGYAIGYVYGRGGYGYLRKTINGWNNAAKSVPFLVLTDLDNAECPPSLISAWLNRPCHANLLFRVAVREVEAWLLADSQNLSHFLHASGAVIVEAPEMLRDPKGALLGIARQSRSAEIRRRVLPKARSTAKQGPDYNGFLGDFVQNYWDVEVARTRSQSLAGTLERLMAFTPSWIQPQT